MSNQTPKAGTDGGERNGAATCCAAGHSLREDGIAADVETLSALGNDTRYKALRLIAGAEDGVCVCELEPSLSVSQSAVNQALSRLFDAGLVEQRKEGRWRYYTAMSRAERLVRALDEMRSNADD